MKRSKGRPAVALRIRFLWEKYFERRMHRLSHSIFLPGVNRRDFGVAIGALVLAHMALGAFLQRDLVRTRPNRSLELLALAPLLGRDIPLNPTTKKPYTFFLPLSSGFGNL